MTAVVRPHAGVPLLTLILSMWFAPKIATVIDVLTRPALRRGFGGAGRFFASVVAETVFFLLLSPIMWVVPHAVPGRRAVRPRARLERAGARDHAIAVVGRAAQVVAADGARGCYSRDRSPFMQPAALPYVFVLLAGGLLLSVPLVCHHRVAMARHGNGSPGHRPPARGNRSAGAAAALALPARGAALDG